MAVAIVISGWLGLNPPGFAAGTVALAFGIAASSLFPTIMMGIFSKKMNKEGAMAGMLAGLFVTLFYVFAHKGIFFHQGHGLLAFDRWCQQHSLASRLKHLVPLARW
jgi:cation/acetate symporter